MRESHTTGRDRAVSPVLGGVLLVAITVVLAGVVVLTVGSFGPGQGQPPVVTVELSADAAEDRITLEHTGGDPINTSELSLQVTVDGEALDHQPPVPFFSASGFASGPTGPFNPSGSTDWTVGEAGSFQIASTNAPTIEPGDTVAVKLVVDGHTVAAPETTAV